MNYTSKAEDISFAILRSLSIHIFEIIGLLSVVSLYYHHQLSSSITRLVTVMDVFLPLSIGIPGIDIQLVSSLYHHKGIMPVNTSGQIQFSCFFPAKMYQESRIPHWGHNARTREYALKMV